MRDGLHLRTRALGAAAILAAAAAPARAAAEVPRGGEGAVVELVLEVEPPDRIIGTTLEQHLRAELRAREIDVRLAPATPGPPAGRPIARVTLHVDHPANGAFLATIRVGDLIMDKRVERTIDLGRLPADGRPLAVAAATDELLRASWVELTIADAPAPVLAPPPAVVRAVAATRRPEPAAPSRVEIGVVATAADLFGHRGALGGEAWIAAWVAPRVALQLRFAADAGLPRVSRDGSARADTFGPGVGVAVALLDHDAPLGVRFEATGEVLRVHLTGTSAGAALASEGSHWSGAAAAMVRGWARTGPVAWTVGVGAVGALHPVAATDDGVTVTSFEGVGGKVDAGLVLSFR